MRGLASVINKSISPYIKSPTRKLKITQNKTKPLMAIKRDGGESRCVAAIFGVTGLVGKEIAKRLLSSPKWKVYGISRRPLSQNSTPIFKNPNFHFISCDLLNPFETQKKLAFLDDVTHIFWVTWGSQFPLYSKECSDQNRAMMVNVLNTLLPRAKSIKHVSLQTGTKHYMSLQFSQNGGYYDENCPRPASPGHNFYYDLEDILKERLAVCKIAWSIQRPGLIMGCSKSAFYNIIGSLCIYGSICKYLNLPFLFGGTQECWEQMHIDASDARLVAEQHIWAATDDAKIGIKTEGEAFNAINGMAFTWKQMWPAIELKFGLEGNGSEGLCQSFSYCNEMEGKGEIWKEIVRKNGLVETEMEDLANWEFLDILFRLPQKLLCSRAKVDQLGFALRYQTQESILYWIDVARQERLIP